MRGVATKDVSRMRGACVDKPLIVPIPILSHLRMREVTWIFGGKLNATLFQSMQNEEESTRQYVQVL